MIYLLLIVCLIFIVIGLRCSHNNIFAPSVMTSAIWFVSLLLFLLLGQNLPDLSNRFFVCLGTWIIGISLTSLFSQAATYRDSRLNEPSLLIRNIYLIISVAYLPTLYAFVYIALFNGQTGNWALDLRLAALGSGSGFTKSFGGIFVLIWQVSFLLELLCYSKEHKWRLILIGTIYLAFGLLTMSKIILLNFFLFSCSILYFKKKITLKHLLSGISILLILFLSLQSLRQAIKFSDVDDNFFITYIVSNLSAFDTLTPCSTEHWGENTFRFFYAFAYDCGWSNIEPVDILLKWIQKPIQTNTYTAMYPYYVDFGIAGIAVFSLFMGFIYGWLYKKAERGSNFHILLYAIAVSILAMQYAADLFFTSFSGNLKLFLIVLIPFLVSKHNLLVLKEKLKR